MVAHGGHGGDQIPPHVCAKFVRANGECDFAVRRFRHCVFVELGGLVEGVRIFAGGVTGSRFGGAGRTEGGLHGWSDFLLAVADGLITEYDVGIICCVVVADVENVALWSGEQLGNVGHEKVGKDLLRMRKLKSG